MKPQAQPVDLERAKWLADHCDQESAFEIQLGKTLRSLIKEIQSLRLDLQLACDQRSAAFRKLEQLQDESCGAVKEAMSDLADFYDTLSNHDLFVEKALYPDEIANGIRQRFGIDNPIKADDKAP